MSERDRSDECCRLCGSALDSAGAPDPAENAAGDDLEGVPATDTDGAATAEESDAGGPFCSCGCREIAAALGAPADAPPTGDDASTSTEDDADALERTFFRVDGMHSALCEGYLESLAENCDGVADAAASYVTEAIRVDYDPERTSAAALEDALSRTGYTAYRREDAADEADGAGAVGDSTTAAADSSASATARAREMRGMRKRRSEDVLEIRYVVGIVFGSFLLVPYLTVFYPVYLADYSSYWLLGLYEETFATFDGYLFLPLFFTLTGVVLYLAGMPLLRGAYISLKLRRPSTHLLAATTIVAAYAYGTLAFVAQRPDIYYDLTILVAATVMAAVFYEETIKRRALNRLTDLTVSQVGTARVLEEDGTTAEKPIEDVSSDDRLLVRAGERIPVDGTLAEGACTVDEAVVTGESLPVSKSAGDAVVGGSIVTGDAAVVDVADRTASSIEDLTRTVWNLQSVDHGVQRRADALAGTFVPLVAAAALLAGGGSVLLGATALETASVVLLALFVASPWALGLATPCSIASSVRDALESGIVVFDESVFERLRGVDVVVFDKTGTLTTGEMRVLEADAPDDVLRAAGALEQRASHPAAAAIADAYAKSGAADGDSSASSIRPEPDGGVADDRSTEAPSPRSIREFERHAMGASATVDGRRVLVGHPDLFRERGWTLEDEDSLDARIDEARATGRLPVLVGRDGRVEGVVIVGDEPRENWAETVSALSETGVEVVVLTGDDDAAARRFRAHSDVSRVFANASPAAKTAAVRRLGADNRVAMVGDGTNDAPALAAADLGISLGGGTALAADAADLAIVEDDLAAVERAFALARAARRRLVRNLRLALSYNAIVIPIALAGLLSPLLTTAALVISAAAIVGNSARPLLEESDDS
ncbi:heavy metal translocating P-type ATPase [Natronolimnohabitans innermongolicus]|uniref:ATPase P n=1 Tax=Natronolimnohabitans innermongolicus JCM 12255 TaxID=1227499 RepID=L9WXZ6_9EURY|nr:heavy metal translocating P-type ATPase [Natronolimnohabitans innermongolicus]ELY54031.1 ATPase P [Natronolimnohabitans innermongolicus JCM 12255]